MLYDDKVILLTVSINIPEGREGFVLDNTESRFGDDPAKLSEGEKHVHPHVEPCRGVIREDI